MRLRVFEGWPAGEEVSRGMNLGAWLAQQLRNDRISLVPVLFVLLLAGGCIVSFFMTIVAEVSQRFRRFALTALVALYTFILIELAPLPTLSS